MPARSDPETHDELRHLLRALSMPFQLTSLLFVVITAIPLGIFIGGDLIRFITSVMAILLILVWLTQYALALIDDAANGVRESRTASIEMAASLMDARAWVHPALAVAVGVLLFLHPEWPRLPVLVGAALLFPASLGACAITGHVLDALHPVEVARVMRGLGIWYPMVVLFVLGCALLGFTAVHHLQSMVLMVATIELLLLLTYAGVGGALFVRRRELAFEPRHSPEREIERLEQQRRQQRQQFIDELYRDVRVRKSAQAAVSVAQWLRNSKPEFLKGDLHAILQAGPLWREPREYPRLLRALLPVLREMQQPALAFAAVEAGLAVTPDFAPAAEADAVALIRYAQQTGRRRIAGTLLANFLATGTAPGDELRALQASLQDTLAV